MSMSEFAPYRWYAGVYDRTGQTEFSTRAWEYVRRRLTGCGWQGERVLDLACGTGAALEAMAADGLWVVGADRAREMLLAARADRRAGAGQLARCDFRALAFADGAFDLVTSFYDSVNYLPTAADLTQALREAARVLRPGGMLVFDLNTRQTLAHHWSGVCHARVDDGLATIWQADWDEPSGISRLRATFFVRADDGRWDRFDEVHDERGFTEAELQTAFRAARFNLVAAEDWTTRRRPTDQSRRVFYFLRK
jgi:SAM-dependent methyltransferase